MTTTVNAAFNTFLSGEVNLEKSQQTKLEIVGIF